MDKLKGKYQLATKENILRIQLKDYFLFRLKKTSFNLVQVKITKGHILRYYNKYL